MFGTCTCTRTLAFTCTCTYWHARIIQRTCQLARLRLHLRSKCDVRLLRKSGARRHLVTWLLPLIALLRLSTLFLGRPGSP